MLSRVSEQPVPPVEAPPAPRSVTRRARVLGGLVGLVVVLGVAALWSGPRGGWWAIAAVGFAGTALLVIVAAVVSGRRMPAPPARRSAVDRVNPAAEQAVRRTGGGGAGGMGSGVAGPPALYRASQPWDATLPAPVTATARGNRAQRRGSARAAQRRDAAISARERDDRRRALEAARRRTGDGPGPRGH